MRGNNIMKIDKKKFIKVLKRAIEGIKDEIKQNKIGFVSDYLNGKKDGLEYVLKYIMDE